jgi:hypothetical protein
MTALFGFGACRLDRYGTSGAAITPSSQETYHIFGHGGNHFTQLRAAKDAARGELNFRPGLCHKLVALQLLYDALSLSGLRHGTVEKRGDL